MVHIEIRGGRASIIEASGSCDTIAGELAAAVGVIYSNLCDSRTIAGDTFRAAITTMLSDRSSVWAESRNVNTGASASMVIAPPMKMEG